MLPADPNVRQQGPGGPANRLNYLPGDMFDHYLRRGYMSSLLNNTGRITNQLTSEWWKATAVACDDEHLFVVYNGDTYVKTLRLYNRRTLQLLWQKEVSRMWYFTDAVIRHYNDLEVAISETPRKEIIVYGDKGNSMSIDMNGENPVFNTVNLTVAAVRHNRCGSTARVAQRDDLLKLCITNPNHHDGELLLPDQTPVSPSGVTEFNTWGTPYSNSLCAINDKGNVCLTWNSNLYIFRFNESYRSNPPKIADLIANNFDVTAHGEWLLFPEKIVWAIIWFVIDNDDNVLAIQDDGFSIYNSAGVLVKRHEIILKKAVVHDGIIYGCTDEGLVIIE